MNSTCGKPWKAGLCRTKTSRYITRGIAKLKHIARGLATNRPRQPIHSFAPTYQFAKAKEPRSLSSQTCALRGRRNPRCAPPNPSRRQGAPRRPWQRGVRTTTWYSLLVQCGAAGCRNVHRRVGCRTNQLALSCPPRTREYGVILDFFPLKNSFE